MKPHAETYEFDEVLTEFASQKRVYEVVAKPVVESVLDGYNGTVMAYGQTGTGKTFTFGQLGEEDTSARGIMLYMETIQDLLDPANDNISIVEDPRTGDVSLPGATHVEIRDDQSVLELLKLGEAHRIAANTKLNTESSRSHAILMVHIKRSVLGEEVSIPTDKSSPKPLVRKSKLVLIDLAGSERVQKSGSEGHMLEEAKCINLSLSTLGKCINALAENSAHVPIRDSKLTRLLRDSFGGKLSFMSFKNCPNLINCDHRFLPMTSRRDCKYDIVWPKENERQQKAFDDEVERINLEAENCVSEAERNFRRLRVLMLNISRAPFTEETAEVPDGIYGINTSSMPNVEPCLFQFSGGPGSSIAEDIAEVKKLLEKETHTRKEAEKEVDKLKSQLGQCTDAGAGVDAEILKLQIALEMRGCLFGSEWNHSVLHAESFSIQRMRRCLSRSVPGNAYSGLDNVSIGVQKVLDLLKSEDANVRIHAVKVVANLAAEASGLTSLLTLLRSYEDETVLRVAAGAIANLAMNAEANQELIMLQGGISLLSITASDAEDPQTLRMVAGAIDNLCGNDKLQAMLRSQGGIKALLGMVRCGHPDVLSQVARGIANFAKCESRASSNAV
ncbi:Armadillo repeat-containing kinesin-like protein 2 [Hibiscus syriacus]|uniref:Kinesin-like protein n=1 Tax=Hibiscus syriacus TaxID=106335 RepID=A0A6A3A1N8_HIBSY|nr:Armadillo repeat-containing kinesin-like protein 2 [Hibiscus syriacus]